MLMLRILNALERTKTLNVVLVLARVEHKH